MAKHRTRVGVHARNDTRFTEGDYGLVRSARIETLKTMSLTERGVYQRLRNENPDLEFIVRLFDDRVRNRSRPDPASFVQRMAPIVDQLRPFCTKFEIHNEPNLASGLEGWGASDADARSFLAWYMHVLQALRRACPWAKFGFPGLAPNGPHRDLEWLGICGEAVRASDWLGCHCYWQYGNMLSDDWGLRFKRYHQRFRDKRIEITEFGNSTPGLAPEEMAQQYVRYYRELNKHFYLGSASAFIASSPDPAWTPFAWMREGGQMQPIVQAVGSMERKAVEVVSERVFTKTGKKVRAAFLTFFDRYGLGLFGNPITDQSKEGGIPTQYFENVAMEEFKTGQIRLKPVGAEVLQSRTKIAELETLVDTLSAEPLPTVEAVIDRLAELTVLLARQIQALQQALAGLEQGSQPTEASTPEAIAEIRAQIGALEALSDTLHAELAAALLAMSETQATLIEHLQAQTQALKEEVEKLRAPQPAPQPPASSIGKPEIADITDKLPTHATEKYATRDRAEIRTLVVHHSATGASAAPETIAKYHVDEWHWPGIGYHFVIGADGKIQQTNHLETVSYHAAGANREGVGICFLGNFMKQPPPDAQIKGGAKFVAWLLQELRLPAECIKGHRELMLTACPGDQWLSGANWKKTLLDQVAQLRK
jgi:hypothetical protein